MPSDADFVRAVLRDPDADEPRLAYAAWLAQRNDPLADFIRVQMQLAEAFRAHGNVGKWSGPYKASKAYIEKHGARWRLPLESLVAEGVVRELEFYRGFVEHVSMDAHAFLAHADRVFAVAPVRHLTLTGVTAAPQALAAPAMERMVSLSLRSAGIDASAIAILAGSPNSHRLAWLDLWNNVIGIAGLEAICSSRHLRALVYVGLSSDGPNPVDTGGGDDEDTVSSTELGHDLEQRFGPQPWIHAPRFFGAGWPPVDVQAAVNP